MAVTTERSTYRGQDADLTTASARLLFTLLKESGLSSYGAGNFTGSQAYTALQGRVASEIGDTPDGKPIHLVFSKDEGNLAWRAVDHALMNTLRPSESLRALESAFELCK